MSFTFVGGALDTEVTTLTDNTATTILDADKQRVAVVGILVTETNGGTHTIKVDLYDGTNAYEIRSAKAFTANETVDVTLGQPIVVPGGWKLRATSGSASGHTDVFVNYYLPDRSLT